MMKKGEESLPPTSLEWQGTLGLLVPVRKEQVKVVQDVF